MNVIAPEIWLLAAACIVAIVDLFVTDPARRPTFWLTQASIAVFTWLHLQAFSGGHTAYTMSGGVVSDPHVFVSIAPDGTRRAGGSHDQGADGRQRLGRNGTPRRGHLRASRACVDSGDAQTAATHAQIGPRST